MSSSPSPSTGRAAICARRSRPAPALTSRPAPAKWNSPSPSSSCSAASTAWTSPSVAAAASAWTGDRAVRCFALILGGSSLATSTRTIDVKFVRTPPAQGRRFNILILPSRGATDAEIPSVHDRQQSRFVLRYFFLAGLDLNGRGNDLARAIRPAREGDPEGLRCRVVPRLRRHPDRLVLV